MILEERADGTVLMRFPKNTTKRANEQHNSKCHIRYGYDFYLSEFKNYLNDLNGKRKNEILYELSRQNLRHEIIFCVENGENIANKGLVEWIIKKALNKEDISLQGQWRMITEAAMQAQKDATSQAQKHAESQAFVISKNKDNTFKRRKTPADESSHINFQKVFKLSFATLAHKEMEAARSIKEKVANVFKNLNSIKRIKFPQIPIIEVEISNTEAVDLNQFEILTSLLHVLHIENSDKVQITFDELRGDKQKTNFASYIGEYISSNTENNRSEIYIENRFLAINSEICTCSFFRLAERSPRRPKPSNIKDVNNPVLDESIQLFENQNIISSEKTSEVSMTKIKRVSEEPSHCNVEMNNSSPTKIATFTWNSLPVSTNNSEPHHYTPDLSGVETCFKAQTPLNSAIGSLHNTPAECRNSLTGEVTTSVDFSNTCHSGAEDEILFRDPNINLSVTSETKVNYCHADESYSSSTKDTKSKFNHLPVSTDDNKLHNNTTKNMASVTKNKTCYETQPHLSSCLGSADDSSGESGNSLITKITPHVDSPSVDSIPKLAKEIQNKSDGLPSETCSENSTPPLESFHYTANKKNNSSSAIVSTPKERLNDECRMEDDSEVSERNCAEQNCEIFKTVLRSMNEKSRTEEKYICFRFFKTFLKPIVDENEFVLQAVDSDNLNKLMKLVGINIS